VHNPTRNTETAKVMSYVFFSTSKCIKVSLSARTRPDLLSADSLTQIPYDWSRDRRKEDKRRRESGEWEGSGDESGCISSSCFHPHVWNLWKA